MSERSERVRADRASASEAGGDGVGAQPPRCDGMSVLRCDVSDGVAVLTLDRPGRLNAIGSDTVALLNDALDAIEADPTVRVVVVTGEGKAFSAGADITELDTLETAHDFARFVRSLTDSFGRLARLPLAEHRRRRRAGARRRVRAGPRLRPARRRRRRSVRRPGGPPRPAPGGRRHAAPGPPPARGRRQAPVDDGRAAGRGRRPALGARQPRRADRHGAGSHTGAGPIARSRPAVGPGHGEATRRRRRRAPLRHGGRPGTRRRGDAFRHRRPSRRRRPPSSRAAPQTAHRSSLTALAVVWKSFSNVSVVIARTASSGAPSNSLCSVSWVCPYVPSRCG